MPNYSKDDGSSRKAIELDDNASELDSVTSDSNSASNSDCNSLESMEESITVSPNRVDERNSDSYLRGRHPVVRVSHNNEDTLLSTCEQGTTKKMLRADNGKQQTDDCSVDTASLTNEPSLVSSYSTDDTTHGSVSPTHSMENTPERCADDTNDHIDWQGDTAIISPQRQQQSENTLVVHGKRHKQYDTDDVLYRTPAFPQLRHRRDYSSTLINATTEGTDYGFGVDVDIGDGDDGLSPTAKHKPSLSSANHNGAHGKSSIPIIFAQFAITTCLVYYVLSVTNSSGGIGFVDSRWKMPSARVARKFIKRIELRNQNQRSEIQRLSRESNFIGQVNSFTVRLRGDRVDLLRRSIEHISRCPGVRQIQIDYPSGNSFPVELLSHNSGKVSQMTSYEVPALAGKQQGSSDAVLLLNEGLPLSCTDVERAFNEWMIDPLRAVGFFAFTDKSTQTSPSSSSPALLSDKALFVHRLYLTSKNLSVMKVPSKSAKCQHLAISAFVSSISLREPYLVSQTSAMYNQHATTKSLNTGSTTESADCVSSILHLSGGRSILSSSSENKNMYTGQSQLRRR